MNIIESYLTKNPCYKVGRNIVPKGLMLHSVGCPQPKASVFINSWNMESHTSACVHAFIDANTGDVYQTLPWSKRGWHGGGSSNDTHIGVEMCEPGTIRYTSGAEFTDNDPEKSREAVLRAYRSAVELFAMLCEKFSLDPLGDGVILSHREGAKRGIATGHVDPEHLWSRYGLTMDQFRADVKRAMEPKPEPPAAARYGTMEEIRNGAPWAADTVEKLIGRGLLLGNGGKDANGDPAGLDLDRDMLRLLVILDRGAAFDR